ncbi:hypothetical protein [Cellulomonas sp. S1-8]|uniref:hypothetical protein n=1 Tax=Cellulomonas sp. S1-8 TaxID=2904790 RepID=UPI0022436B30|nr:hypothetical protein [Cellulomonas sp. S1-8]UZN03834.1 hypothetical protein OKX07_02515 [Cellulomonas sp. S1-8]
MTEKDPTATAASTREALLRGQARGYTQVRRIFVQHYEGDGTPRSRASMLARFVHERKHRALVLYLLLLGSWAGVQKLERPPAAAVWVRALRSDRPGALTWSPSTLSRTWADLSGMGLVARKREDRLVRIRPRREDGLADYEPPGGRKEFEHTYFALPDEFWTDEWFAKLSLPALAVFLVIAKETQDAKEFRVTHQQLEDWFGINKRTAGNGLRQLEELGLLHVRKEVVAAPLSATGSTTRHWYSLTGAFGSSARKALQKRAGDEVRARATGSAAGAPRSKSSSTGKSR